MKLAPLRLSHLIALAAIFMSALLTLQGATFGYVVSIERRLTELELLQKLRDGRRKLNAEAGIAPFVQAYGDGIEDDFGVGFLVKGVAHCGREECEGLSSLRGLVCASARAHVPAGVEDRGAR